VVILLALVAPFYADAVYHRILTNRLSTDAQTAGRPPPFAFMYRYEVYWQQPAPWPAIRAADVFMAVDTPRLINLPRTAFVHFYRTTHFSLHTDTGNAQISAHGEAVAVAPFVSMDDFGAHIQALEGAWPRAAACTRAAVPVMISPALAAQIGAQVGHQYTATLSQGRSDALAIPVVIAGIWEARDPTDPYWFYTPDSLSTALIVRQDVFDSCMVPHLTRGMAEVMWYMDFDGAGLRVWDVPSFIERIHRVADHATARGVQVKLGLSPLDGLLTYQHDSQALMVLLYTFSIPLFALALVFVGFVASLSAYDQRHELAVLRSRGASLFHIVGITFIRYVLLGGLALLGATPIATFAVIIIGQSNSFFRLEHSAWEGGVLSPHVLPIGLAAMLVAVLCMIFPVAGVSRRTIVSQKIERARSLKLPWFQRSGLDVLLLIPSIYWSYLLLRQGYVDLPGIPVHTEDPLGNPALFLIAALTMFVLVLLLTRLVPGLLRLLAWLFGLLPGKRVAPVVFLLVLRQLARSSRAYVACACILAFTVALAIYTATMSTTLDQQLVQNTRHRVGSDVRLVETGLDTQMTLLPGMKTSRTADETAGGPRWLLRPISDYMRVPGVQAVTRAGNYRMLPLYAAGSGAPGRFLGVERSSFAQVAYWRRDFAQQPLGGLMNALSNAPDAILIPEEELTRHALLIGDSVRVRVSLPDIDVVSTFKIVGTFKHWPTWFPTDSQSSPLFVGNLDALFEQAGGQAPYDVWVKADGKVRPVELMQKLRTMDKWAQNYLDVETPIMIEQHRPQWQGLFGMLTIAISASAMIAVLGFALYAAFSYRTRAIELGVLRALGLSTAQLGAMLALEILLLIVLSMAGGVVVGVGASRIFIPLLQRNLPKGVQMLPFEIMTDPQALWLLGLGFAFSLFIMFLLLQALSRRIRLFEVIKLGETF
jgi:putative ABC transport system permease protein